MFVTRTRTLSLTDARQAWEGFGPTDADAPARCQTFATFVAAHAPHLDVEHDDPADVPANLTAAFGEVVEVRDGFEVVANGFGGTTTRRAAASTESPAATDKQKSYLRSLLAERAGVAGAEAVRSHLNHVRTLRVPTRKDASLAIEALLAIPKATTVAPSAPPAPAERPKPAKAPNQYAGKCFLCGKRVEALAGLRSLTDEGKWAVEHDGVCPTAFPFPEGRYAVPTEAGPLGFYHLFDGVVLVQASSDLHPVPQPAATAIIAKIASDPEAASRTYGREIGSCGRCGRVLTNEASRSAGIGPVCESKGF